MSIPLLGHDVDDRVEENGHPVEDVAGHVECREMNIFVKLKQERKLARVEVPEKKIKE